MPVSLGIQHGSKSPVGTMDIIELDVGCLHAVDVRHPEAVRETNQPVTAHAHPGGHEVGGTVGCVQHHLVTRRFIIESPFSR